ncbi:branched-chain amino acid ABC transporter permease [Cytobacillus sp. S13-E01]|uniref:branched-chain amino acid ABC transporter permease n=1 Tax=Cytobacillus sp. S13-E01 TaxID=3031326 RepID=UPI0023D7E409|nr:branched-chain amino acid ABC transporter permease [Cytobacillus sp. S13-E01]MDF0725414.1 branched-chain amino acid ABC transporter permease [Cytobacillus sp. S13-E01]
MGRVFSNKNVLLILLVLAILFPLVTQNNYYNQVMILVFIWSIAVYGLNIISGYTGQLSLAHAGFFAIGAYSLGLLTVKAGMNFWLAFPLACLISGVAGLLVGIVALRTRSHFFAIYTMCVGVIIYLIIDKWDDLTGGVRGLIGIPSPDAIGPITFTNIVSQYYLVLFFLILTIFIVKRIAHSLFGRTLVAIRNSEELARTIGISIMKNQLLAFALSSFFAGLAGALYSSFIRFIGPDISAITVTFELLLYLLVGGIGTLTGPILGTFLVVWLTQSLQFLEEYRMVLFGPIVVLIMLFYPRGLVGGYVDLKHYLNRKKSKKVKNVNSNIEEAG